MSGSTKQQDSSRSTPKGRLHPRILLASLCFALFGLFPDSPAAREIGGFRDLEVETPYLDCLLANPDLMKNGGARLFEDQEGSMILVGVGKVLPEDTKSETLAKARRIGEIRARTAILELGYEIEISTSRKTSEIQTSTGPRPAQSTTLSSFFQIAEAKVEGEIQQLPVIGTWWSSSLAAFYVAVGKILDGPASAEKAFLPVENNSFQDMEGQEPYVSLLRASPLLLSQGGVRGFFLPDGKRVLLAVGSAAHDGNYAKGTRVAHLKAIRSLLGHEKGLQVLQMERISDSEYQRPFGAGMQNMLLSQFLSIQEERVSGTAKALPVVAKWRNGSGELIYIAIGEKFESSDNIKKTRSD